MVANCCNEVARALEMQLAEERSFPWEAQRSKLCIHVHGPANCIGYLWVLDQANECPSHLHFPCVRLLDSSSVVCHPTEPSLCRECAKREEHCKCVAWLLLL